MTVMKTLSYGPEAWKALNGIFCVYKPSGVSVRSVLKSLKLNLCRGLNELQPRETREMVSLKGSVCSMKPFEVELVPNYADHQLVSGPRYQEQDIRLAAICQVGYNVSGVTLMAINDSCWKVRDPLYMSLVRRYEVKGKLGVATTNFMSDGRTVARSTYNHVKEGALGRILSSIQASHQCLAYEYCGVNPQSQAAYELASSGLVKPASRCDPLIYSIKCTEFKLPNFTLEIHCLHETEGFLAELVHDIGVDLKSCAVCTQLRRVQFGHFVPSHALLRKHWTLENVLNNLTLCREVFDQNLSSVDLRSILASKPSSDLVEDMREVAREASLER